ncbi:MAG: glycosyltransferase [Spirochaetales bacterium]|nr:glycosyltransferase [Spirochaetales bacterium]
MSSFTVPPQIQRALLIMLNDTLPSFTNPPANAVHVAHIVSCLKKSSGIPPAALGICEAILHVGGQVKLFAGHAETSFEPEINVPYRTSSVSFTGRYFGWTIDEVKQVKRQRNEGWAVHVHGLWSGANFVERWSRPHDFSPPFIFSPHGMFSPAALAQSRWRKRLVWWLSQRRQLATTSLVHVTSEAERDDVRAAGVRQPVACLPLPVPSPVRLKRLTGDDQSLLRIGFLGRIAPIKRIELLIDAFKKVFNHRYEAELLIAGPIIDSGYGNSLLRRTRGCSSICWLGEISGPTKEKFFKEIDLLVLPSASENFGVVVTEALSIGIPVAASMGTPWKVLSDQGLGFYGFNDVIGLTMCLTKAKELGKAGLAALGEGGPAHVENNYSYKTIGRKWVELHHWLRGYTDPPPWVEVPV